MRQALPTSLRLLLLAFPAVIAVGAAHAHTSERAYILLLPTNLYIFGGAAVVGLSFVVMMLIPKQGRRWFEQARWRLGALPRRSPVIPSLLTFAVLAALVAAGHVGSRDPLANPLTMAVWSLWWVGFTFLCALFGNLWAWLNPWRGAYRVLMAIGPLRPWRHNPPLEYPAWLGHWPAVVLFFAFAWFELVHPAPQDPALIANGVMFYAAITLSGMVLFGEPTWLRGGEAFSVFYRMVGWLSPIDQEEDGSGSGGRAVALTFPGARLLRIGALPLSGIAFVVLALSSVSFDGLSRTFWWLDLIGVNPMEYPGRTVLMGAGTAGLLGMFTALMAAYTAAVGLGRVMTGAMDDAGEHLGRFITAIIPIAFGYHFAHYLPEFPVDVQYAVAALSDPFGLGWNLLGARGVHVNAAFLGDHYWVQLIWYVQVAVIVIAHVVAVGVSHFLALSPDLDDGPQRRRAAVSQIPMTVLMIGYTSFGLWLLSTPVIG